MKSADNFFDKHRGEATPPFFQSFNIPRDIPIRGIPARYGYAFT